MTVLRVPIHIPEHYVEAFMEGPLGPFGWQCFTCHEEASGFSSFNSAERAGTSHVGCPHDSFSGANDLDLLDPEKVWRCDHCGHVRVGPR